MNESARGVVVVGTGFALYRFAATYLYGSGLGMHEESVGFVSDLAFVLSMNAVSCIAALVCLALLRSGRFGRRAASPWVASAVLLVGVAVGRCLAGAAFPPAVVSVLAGALCGVGLFILCVVWLDVLMAQGDAADTLRQLAFGYTLYTALVVLCEPVSNGVSSALAALALVVSAAIARHTRAETPDTTGRSSTMPATERYAVLPVYACFFVLVGVVGLMHTSVLGSSSEYIVGAVPMWLTRVVSLVLFLAIVLLMGRRFNLGVVFKVAFPLFIAVMTLLPFLGTLVRPFIGLAAIICYCVCAMLSNVFIVREGRRLELSSALLAAVYTLGSSGCLLVGLCTGMALSAVSASFDLSLLTLLAFVAIYPLVCVLVFLLRRDGRMRVTVHSMPEDASDGAFPEGAGAGEPLPPGAGGAQSDALPPARGDFERAVASIAEKFDLTKREREVLSYLALGRSVRFVAETLVISENTAWTHAKRIYAKTGAHGRDGLMALVEGRVGGVSS